MKTTRSAAVAFVVLTLAGCGSASSGTPDAASESSSQSSAATLIEQPPLAEDVEALPRLAEGGPSIARLNADLDAKDAAALESRTICLTDAANGPGGGWSRTITRPMTGPGYVTVREHLDYYCGGPYPTTQQIAVTYDLATGRPVDWVASLPGLDLSVRTFDDMPPGYVPLVSSTRLSAWYSRKRLSTPDPASLGNCRETLEPEALGEQSFNIWADAANGGVSVSPDFPHVSQACAEPATLTPADLRAFGAAPGFVEAVAAAQAAGNWTPKNIVASEAPAS